VPPQNATESSSHTADSGRGQTKSLTATSVPTARRCDASVPFGSSAADQQSCTRAPERQRCAMSASLTGSRSAVAPSGGWPSAGSRLSLSPTIRHAGARGSVGGRGAEGTRERRRVTGDRSTTSSASARRLRAARPSGRVHLRLLCCIASPLNGGKQVSESLQLHFQSSDAFGSTTMRSFCRHEVARRAYRTTIAENMRFGIHCYGGESARGVPRR